jgi:pimeloyl-ACP methyl ester carboxylesterase
MLCLNVNVNVSCQGSLDKTCPFENLQRLTALIPHAQTHVFPDCGHNYMLEDWERWRGLLLNHFKGAKL